MQVTRPTLSALLLGAFLLGSLFPLPASTAQIPPDFTFASGESVDRLTVVVEAVVGSMAAPQFARFEERLTVLADNQALPSGLREQAREVLATLERQRPD